MSENFISLLKIKNGSFNGDFNGKHSALSLDGQLDYLDKYFYLAKKEYKFNEIKHVVNKSEIDALINKIPYEKFEFRNRVLFKNGKAKLIDLNKYKYITLFEEAFVQGKSIILNDSTRTVLPSFEIECDEFKHISFSLFMDKKYNLPLRGGVDTMVASRNIEFKNELNEVIKFGLYSNGNIYARTISKDQYHHDNILVGTLIFDDFNSIDIDFSKDKIEISINGKNSCINTITKLPNMMFAGSGLHARYMWSFTINNIIDKNNKIIDVFKVNENKAASKEDDICLPYVFGTYINRHLSCIYEKQFEITNVNKHYLLIIEEIGPSGTIYLNNKEIFKSKSVSQIQIDISKYLTIGKNSLRIVINPRAPENVISWHKNKDLYFGSYLGNIYLENVNDSYIKSVYVNTTKIAKNNISVSNSFNINGDYSKIKITIYDLNKNRIFETYKHNFTFKGMPWSCANPNLYRIIYQLYKENELCDEYEVITGFRTIAQKNGELLINNKKEILKGALLMQYLYPYKDITLNHVMPKEEQILMEILQAKKMNSNCVRMHQLGYGTNDFRLARICDYIGITSIWTTRCIDSAFGIIYEKKWVQKEEYQNQMKRVINSPSIIMWEGNNESYLFREDIDVIYKEFVNGIKEIDKSRLISPVSHLYYANDSYDKGCQYYQDNGKKDEFFNKTEAVKEWNDSLVVRSAHTYSWLLGYGSTWDALKVQPWSAQPYLLNSKKHMYMVSEYAIIGRQNPNILEAKEFFNNNSYEYNDELINGYKFDDSTWYLSQAYQSLAATYATRKMLSLGVDGLLWCSLNGGANDGSYLKPIIDFYGYPKLAFYALQNCFSDVITFLDDVDIVWDTNHLLKPVIITNLDHKKYKIDFYIKDENNSVVYETVYSNVRFKNKLIRLKPRQITNLNDGYYSLYSNITKMEDK